MKKNIILSSILMFFVAILFSGCNKNEPFVPEPNPRDGVYEGDNLTVSINGETVTSIKSVSVSSIKIPYAQGTIVGDNGSNGLDVYTTSITFKGFPGTDEEITLETVSTIYYFDGLFNIRITDDVQYYEFLGTFTGDPDSPHSEQGLILEFRSIENPS